MGTVTISLEDSTEDSFRNYVYKEYGKSKGVLGKAINEALKKWLEEKRQDKIAKEALADLKKGHKFGKLLYKKREELYER